MKATLVALFCAAVAASESCSCARIAAVETELAALKRTVTALEAMLPVAGRGHAPSASTTPLMKQEVAAQTGATSEAEARRLAMVSGGKTYAATRAWQLHEFPASHTCASPGKAYLKPLMAVEGMTELDEPTSPSVDVSLMSNVDGQTRSEIQQMPFPLKVTHATDCSVAPALTLQLDTTVSGSLSVTGALTASGKDVVTALRSLGPVQDPFHAWTVATGSSMVSNPYAIVCGSCDTTDYRLAASTRAPIVTMTYLRPASITQGHMHIGLDTSATGDFGSSMPRMYMSYLSDNCQACVRTMCADGEVWHGTDAYGSAGSGNPADDNLLTDSDAGDSYSITLVGTTVSFYALKHQNGQSPFRTCTVASGSYYGKITLYAANNRVTLPSITNA